MPRYEPDNARDFFGEWLVGNESPDGEQRAYCPLCEDIGASNSPSASFNFVGNKWNCLKTDADGGSISRLLKTMRDRERGGNVRVIRRAVSQAEDRKALPVSEDEVEAWHEYLLSREDLVDEIENTRGWSRKTLINFMIGYNRGRYTIPIYDENDQLVNVRQYKPGDAQKMISIKGHGKNRLWGFDTLRANTEILLCAGEPDRILAVQEGFAAVTWTGGEGNFQPEWAHNFTGKIVYICLDADEAGRAGTQKIVEILQAHAADVWAVTLTEKTKGYDITDMLMEEGKTALQRYLDEAELVGGPDETIERFPRLDLVALLRADRPEREWLIRGLIPLGTSTALVAPAGTGKSLFLLAAMISVVRGDPEFAGLPISKRRVLYVDMENTEDDLAERFRDLGVGIDDVEQIVDLVPIHLPPLAPLDTEAGAQEIVSIIDAYGIQAGDVVVLDSFQRVTEGKEDSSDTYRAYYRETGIMLKRRGLTVIRTDNTGKDTEKGARGSSGKRDDVDLELFLERDKSNCARITIKPGKLRIPDVRELTLDQHIGDDGRITYSTAADLYRIQVNDALDALERHDIPVEMGENKAWDLLKKEKGILRKALRDAVKERKSRAGMPGTPSREEGQKGRAAGKRHTSAHPGENGQSEHKNRAEPPRHTNGTNGSVADHEGVPLLALSTESGTPDAQARPRPRKRTEPRLK